MTADLDAFLAQCRSQPDRFAAISADSAWRVGGVLFARSNNHFVAVRKEAKAGYQFSGLWAMPGGMVRVPLGAGPFAEAAVAALSNRFEAEAGIRPVTMTPARHLGPVVTTYTVNSVRRFTLITVFTTELDGAFEPRSADRSIAEARWFVSPPDLVDFAPANTLLLGHLLWDGLDDNQRESVRSLIAAALAECAEGARAAGVSPPAAPWESDDARSAWAAAWPARETDEETS